MCGLVAIYKNDEQELAPKILESMVTALSHRGPDDYGYAFVSPDAILRWKDENQGGLRGCGVALGHRRLSILDLSASGAQPFFSADRQVVLVFNGEIFNYVELRKELQMEGFDFVTDTDTEVLLQAYRKWGTGCFERFNGMWAMVLWDASTDTLIASRDRFGIKPLLYARGRHNWYFASEAKSLFKAPEVCVRPNLNSVSRYLSNKSLPATGESFFAGLNTITPGTYLTLRNGEAKEHRYWNMPCGNQVFSDIDKATERLDYLLTDSVRLRMRADVRVGTMLSGGLDSTSVIAKISELLRSDPSTRRSVGDSLQAYNAAFPTLEIDESNRVNEVVNRLGLGLQSVYPLDEMDVEKLYDDALVSMERPFSNAVPMVHTLLMRKARATGVKVVLNGHGADELLGGYPRYIPILSADYLRRGQLRSCLSLVRGMSKRDEFRGLSALTRTLDHALPYRLRPWRKRSGRPTIFTFQHGRKNAGNERPAGRSALDQILKHDFMYKVLPSWLDMEDRISMSESIEARVPFLDYRLVEFAFSIEDSLKIHDGSTKYILRKAMQDVLPKSIVAEKKKFFFSGPDATWMRGALKPMIKSTLCSTDSRVRDFVDGDVLQSELAQFFDGKSELTGEIWRVLNTEMWLRRFF